MKKIMVSIIAVLVLISAVILPTFTAGPDDPQWDNTNLVSADIVFENGIGYAEGIAIAKPNASSVMFDVVVYKQTATGWEYVGEEHSIDYSTSGGISCQFSATRYVNYRADFTFTVTRYGIDEVIPRTEYELYDSSWD